MYPHLFTKNFIIYLWMVKIVNFINHFSLYFSTKKVLSLLLRAWLVGFGAFVHLFGGHTGLPMFCFNFLFWTTPGSTYGDQMECGGMNPGEPSRRLYYLSGHVVVAAVDKQWVTGAIVQWVGCLFCVGIT